MIETKSLARPDPIVRAFASRIKNRLGVVFGDVRRDRRRGTQELVRAGQSMPFKLLATWYAQADRNPVDIELTLNP